MNSREGPVQTAVFGTASELRFQIEHFSTISAARRNVLMHMQVFIAVQVVAFISASNGTPVANGPFESGTSMEGLQHVSSWR